MRPHAASGEPVARSLLHELQADGELAAVILVAVIITSKAARAQISANAAERKENGQARIRQEELDGINSQAMDKLTRQE